MKNGKFILAPAVLAITMMAGTVQTGPANAVPIAVQSQLGEAVKNGNVQEVGWRKQRIKRFFKRQIRGWRWCKNHPRRCHGRPWRRAYAVGGALCHHHVYKVPGMHFHPGVRCGHRHYRTYRSWVWE